MFSFELQERPNADADRNHAADEPLTVLMQWRALHGCGGREAPFGLDGLGNVAGENRRCAMLLCAFHSDPAIKSQHVNERWRGFVGAGSTELRAVR